MVCLLAIGTIVVQILFDVQYYSRVITTVLLGRLFEKKKKVTEPTTIYGVCFTQDLDIIFKHMNNARFVRDLDFARFHFYDRTGLFSEVMKKKGGEALQAATNIRYRKVIPFFSFYKIVTQLIYWDEKSIYVEQKFITNDDFIRAIVLSKQTILKVNVEEIMRTLEAGPKPAMPRDLELWLQSMEVSSEKLRPKQQ